MIARRSGLTNAEVRAVLSAIREIADEVLSVGRNFSLPGIFHFEWKIRRVAKFVHPKTKQVQHLDPPIEKSYLKPRLPKQWRSRRSRSIT